jgi:hypothetical protein
MRFDVKRGQVNTHDITSVHVVKMTFDEFIKMDRKPLIYHNGDVLSHIDGNEFVISGICYGDETEHYFKINEDHIHAVIDSIIVNKTLGGILLDSFSHQPQVKEIKKTYIMIDEATSLFKIGRSSNPTTREQTLQSIKPVIKLIATLDRDIEKDLHEEFKDYRVRGEWFRIDFDVVFDVISKNNFKIINK